LNKKDLSNSATVMASHFSDRNFTLAACYAVGLQASISESFMWLFPIFWIVAFGACIAFLPKEKARAYLGFAALLLLFLILAATPSIVE